MPHMPAIAEQAEVISRSHGGRLAPAVTLAQIDDAVKQATSLENLLRRLQDMLR